MLVTCREPACREGKITIILNLSMIYMIVFSAKVFLVFLYSLSQVVGTACQRQSFNEGLCGGKLQTKVCKIQI